MRYYDEVVRRVEALEGFQVQTRVLAEVEGFPVFGIQVEAHAELPTVLVVGGTHGDEPAGVEAALAFAEQDALSHTRSLRFEIIPCLNPYGYVHNTRHNRQDLDINWSFQREDVPEAGVVRRVSDGRRFEAFVDLHEDWESPGYYVYEIRRGGNLISPEMVRSVAEVCPVNTNPCIEGAPARAGVISPDLDAEVMRRGEGVPISLFLRHTDHLLTSETPTGQPMARRVMAHRIALKAMIGEHSRSHG